PRLLVLTGAGLSTESGIPAYRDASGRWLRRDPIMYQDFMRCALTRRRYWARSFFGWQLMQKASPNRAHLALAMLEQAGRMSHLITQNVDGLHQRAGSRRLIELHGHLAGVSCQHCGQPITRELLQEQLAVANPDWAPAVLGYNPDGDAELDASAYPGFQVVDCQACGGPLKPDVVFFGESVPRDRLTAVEQAIAQCDALLVVGSSLVVMSGLRIVRAAHRRGLPVAAVNEGRTRADGMLDFKLAGDCVDQLHHAVDTVLTRA
ncbi:MAG: NAD-dependent protein deacetylase, partial [Wenzhouxiangella sp.]|nr:NAD-dependent protein deacetylase [Wenzhouxiangella sp.]